MIQGADQASVEVFVRALVEAAGAARLAVEQLYHLYTRQSFLQIRAEAGKAGAGLAEGLISAVLQPQGGGQGHGQKGAGQQAQLHIEIVEDVKQNRGDGDGFGH